MKAVRLVEDIGSIFLNLVRLHYESKEKEKSTERALTQPRRRSFAETFLDIGVARGVERGQWRAVAQSGWPWPLFGRSETARQIVRVSIHDEKLTASLAGHKIG
jgi:hypothetical protein